jgi:hypothetical protein
MEGMLGFWIGLIAGLVLTLVVLLLWRRESQEAERYWKGRSDKAEQYWKGQAIEAREHYDKMLDKFGTSLGSR